MYILLVQLKSHVGVVDSGILGAHDVDEKPFSVGEDGIILYGKVGGFEDTRYVACGGRYKLLREACLSCLAMHPPLIK